MARVVVNPARVPSSPSIPTPTDFYRAEFTRHRECLEALREYFSESAITDADAALAKVISQLEQLCAKDDAEQLLAGPLRKFNAITGLSGWSDPKQLH
jgi:hypothetical protein